MGEKHHHKDLGFCGHFVLLPNAYKYVFATVRERMCFGNYVRQQPSTINNNILL